MFQRILIPLDGSRYAERALRPALKVAHAVQGNVILLHSMLPVYTGQPELAGEYNWSWPPEALDRSRAEADAYLGRIKERYVDGDYAIERIALEGDEAGLIVDTAIDEDIDLIVMSPHGHSGYQPWTLGSVAERVLQVAPCPVLLVRTTRPIETILVLLDGSELSEKAVWPSLLLSDALEAPLTLMRVTPPLVERHIEGRDVECPPSDALRIAQERACDQAISYLNVIATPLVEQGYDVDTVVRSGEPADTILRYASAHDFDMIAMTTHGRSGIRRWLHGSVTGKVLRRWNKSMLVIRPYGYEQ